MDFVALVNKLRERCGASAGAVPLLSLGGTLSQENARFKNWINEAWLELQNMHNGTWLFMERPFSFTAATGDGDYVPTAAPASLADFRNWKTDTFRAYQIAVGFSDEQVLPFLSWNRFRDLYKFGSNRTLQGRPVLYSVGPDKTLYLGPLPDADYNVNGYYYKKAQTLVGDTDAPTQLDDDYHMLIVYIAMGYYGIYEAASEVLAEGARQKNKFLALLEVDQLPAITSCEPLA
jgi:hypothetical protein